MDKRTQQKRDEIVEQIQQIDRLRQGTISEQYYGTDEKRQGPYYVLQGYTDGRHWSKRVPKEQIEQVRADIASGGHFRELCQDFAEITEQATVAAERRDSKKNAKKRRRSVTGKLKRS